MPHLRRAVVALAAAPLVSLTVLLPAGSAAPAATPPVPIGWPTVTSASQTNPVTLSAGVTEYSETYQTVDGPEHTQVLSVDLRHHQVRSDVVEAQDRVYVPEEETTTSMADRTGAVAAINGDYFAINAAGNPLGGVLSGGQLVKSPRVHYQAQLEVRSNGTMSIGEVDFSGSVRDGHAGYVLRSVNVLADAASGEVTEVTPAMGEVPSVPAETLVIGHTTTTSGNATTMTVDEVRPSVTRVPALAPGQVALLAGGAGGSWLTADISVGDSTVVRTSLTGPRPAALLSGATVLVRGGRVYDDPTGTPPPGRNPETMVGLSADGRHALLVVIDGRQDSSIGVSPAEAAEYLVAHGADSGILLDGGGSSTLVGRLPGTASTTILNSPSDSSGERPVGNALCLYAD